jgi:histidinol-phosphate aminotransferase
MTESLSHTVFRQEVLALTAYKVADANNLIKLDAMENPYSWPDEVITEWLQAIKSCPMNRYPDPEARQLAKTIKTTNHIPDNAAILLGNGSDEIIQILLMALPPDAKVLAPEPGFVMYKQVAKSLGLEYLGIPLQTDTFDLNIKQMINTILEQQPAVIFLAYPNNPTGNLFATEDMIQIIQATQGLVIVDEAYAPFTDASFMNQLGHFPNVMVMRTVSKLGLAGLRLGYLAGAPELINELNKIRLPYNINSLTQMTADFALKNMTFLLQQTTRIRQQREWLFEQLNTRHGIEALPSEANFILFRCQNKSANAIFDSLLKQGILIKNLSPQGGMLNNCLRVTVGTEQENSTFVSALDNALKTD